MKTLGERLKDARKSKGLSQEALASSVGVSRGVIQNLEYNRAEPQPIVIKAICNTLNINENWLLTGEGDMVDNSDAIRSAKILSELYDVAKDLSEEEQLYILDVIQSMKKRFGNKSGN